MNPPAAFNFAAHLFAANATRAVKLAYVGDQGRLSGNALTFSLSAGASVVLMAERPTPDAVFKRWTAADAATRPTVFFGAPTGFASMLASPALPTREAVRLRLCSSAGEALPRELGERFERHFGVPIVDGIGSTEMLHIFISNRPGAVRYGTTGNAVEGYEIELRGDDGGPVADGEVGDLFIKGPSAALMYWSDRERSRSTFQGDWIAAATSIRATPTATTPMPAAATTCSR